MRALLDLPDDPPIAGADSAFCLHIHKIAVSAPARGSNPTILAEQKRWVRPRAAEPGGQGGHVPPKISNTQKVPFFSGWKVPFF